MSELGGKKLLKLVNANDPLLTTICQLFDFADPPFDAVNFAHELVKFMYESNGIGLAANQVGVPYRIFAMRGAPENFVCINPRIVDNSTETTILEEGCLTYPGLLVKIKRPSIIKVRFNTPNGDTKTEKFIGMTARIFQHEYCHILGKPFFEGALRYHLEQGIKKAKNKGYNYEHCGFLRFASKK